MVARACVVDCSPACSMLRFCCSISVSSDSKYLVWADRTENRNFVIASSLRFSLMSLTKEVCPLSALARSSSIFLSSSWPSASVISCCNLATLASWILLYFSMLASSPLICPSSVITRMLSMLRDISLRSAFMLLATTVRG